jgi:hypothetical protein
MKSLLVLVTILSFSCSSSQKKTTDDAASTAPVVEEAPAVEEAAPVAPAMDAGAVSMDAMTAAGADDEHPPMPTPKK